MYKNEAVNKAIAEKRFLQQYVRDAMGMKRGMAIAIKEEIDGKDVVHLGLSMMHPDDQGFMRTRLLGFPSISKTAHLLRRAAAVDDEESRLQLVDMYTKKLINQAEAASRRLVPLSTMHQSQMHYLSYPTFDREVALRLAYSDAKHMHGCNFELTRDPAAQEVCRNIAKRAAAYFKVDIDIPTYRFASDDEDAQLDFLMEKLV